jgi:hypothetical protein
MSIQVAGDTAGTRIVDAEVALKNMRVGIFPVDGNHYSVFSSTGATTGLGAGSSIFSFRNISTNVIIVTSVSLTATATTGFTAAQRLGAAITVCRNWTVSDSGGTAIALTGNTNKLRTSQTTVTSIDCRIATTVAITAGTRTIDTFPVDGAYGFVAAAAAGVGVIIPPVELYINNESPHPLVLAQNEGIIITLPVAMGAGGVVSWDITLKFIERPTY